MHLAGFISRALFVLALICSATVPDGFMRAQGPGGMSLVLCTTDGTQEVWLTDTGEVVSVEGSGTGHDPHDGSSCVQLTVSSTENPPHPGALIRLSPWPTVPPLAGEQCLASAHHPKRHRTRAPPPPA
ncbi:hypothetical protein ACFORG_07690 [Lutimaribacter marinistellae]|uniref:Secreted protein n=1 Tax=Lutimaribacter marinistellae TaxID=1820329 RepID=A0ABV7TFI0_9RHOB